MFVMLSGLKLTKIENPRVYNVEMSVSTISSDEKTGQLHAKVEIGSLSYTIHKISSKCIKDLNVRSKAKKLLKENLSSLTLVDDDFFVCLFCFDSKNEG